jgi:hypothetical protein
VREITDMASNKGTLFPKKGTLFPNGLRSGRERVDYAAGVSVALREHFNNTNHATKIVMQWTGASERAVKNWFAGTKGPSAVHLCTLMRHSDAVFVALLRMSGRECTASHEKLIEVRQKLDELRNLVVDLSIAHGAAEGGIE